MHKTLQKIVIVGAGITAATAAGTLRAEGFEGVLTVIGDEPYAPYSRPPLSKDVLENPVAFEAVQVAELPEKTELVTGAAVTSLDPIKQTVTLENGNEISYDGLLIATGSRARVLNPHGPKEHVLRSYDDAVEISKRLKATETVLVVGGGFLGMEIASTMNKLGKNVTVVDIFPPLERQFGKYLAQKMTAVARSRGVTLRIEKDGIETTGDEYVMGVRTSTGEKINADLVISAVGDVPNVEWLASAGLADQNGISVNAKCQVTRNIVAAGDVVRVGDGRRTPHWGAALDQARLAAKNLLNPDAAQDYLAAPYFWTEQWGLDIKICGIIPTDVEPDVLEGSWEENSLLLQYRVDGQPVAAATVNKRFPIFKLRKLAQPEQVSA